MRIHLGVAKLLLLGMGTACATTHVAPYEPKRRTYDPAPIGEPARPEGASLLALGQPGLFEYPRAQQVGDQLVIYIDESENASREATTALDRRNSQSYGIPNAFGLLERMRTANFDPARLLTTESRAEFDGEGKTTRSGRLRATLAVRVRKVLPNGELFVEGHKVVMVSNEEHHLYVSGLVRPIDIGPDNAVPSSRVSDAEIEYTGRGDASDQQRPGIISRWLAKLWPF